MTSPPPPLGLDPSTWLTKLKQTDPTLLKGAIRSFAVNGVGVALGFLTQSVLARTLGTRGYGLYIYVLGWANVAGLLCALEFGYAGVRFVSVYAARDDWPSLRGFIRRSHQIVVGTTLFTAITGVIITMNRAGLDAVTEFSFLAVCALFPLTSLVQLQGGILLGLKRVTQSQAPFQVMRPALFALMVIVVSQVIGTERFLASHAVGLQFVATAAALIATTWALRKEMPNKTFAGATTFHTGEWIRASSHFVAISVAQLVLSTQADLLIVGALLTNNDTALYGAASQLAMLVAFGATAVLTIAQPMIAELYARGEFANLKRVSLQIVRLTLLVSLPVFLFMVVAGPYLLHVYGRPFMAAYPVLIVLCVAQLFAAVLGSLLGYLFTMTSHQHTATRIIGVSAALNILLTLVLTPRFGIIGTASATAISTIARSGALLYASRAIFKSGGTLGGESPAA